MPFPIFMVFWRRGLFAYIHWCEMLPAETEPVLIMTVSCKCSLHPLLCKTSENKSSQEDLMFDKCPAGCVIYTNVVSGIRLY